MPELSVTDEQLRRLESVREELEAAYVGPYGTVRTEDALEYLLDTYDPPEPTDETTTEGDTSAETASETAADTAERRSGTADIEAGTIEALSAIDGVGEVTAKALAEAGFDSVAAIEAATPAALTAADGVGEKQAVDIVAAAAGVDDSNTEPEGDESDEGGEGGEGDGGEPPAESPEDTLQQAMSLLDAHEDRWRESSGDEPYEVDIPDGSTEAVRTKDDVKRLLFKHWK